LVDVAVARKFVTGTTAAALGLGVGDGVADDAVAADGAVAADAPGADGNEARDPPVGPELDGGAAPAGGGLVP
jgi:hypothetical protein